MVRVFRDQGRRNRADAGYVLQADRIFTPEKRQQGFVPIVVCNREGEWVTVGLQNFEQDDDQSLKPMSKDGSSRLVALAASPKTRSRAGAVQQITYPISASFLPVITST